MDFRKLTLGFSPCPNDTFMFDALVHGKIDTEGLSFEPVLEDVESLNMLAMQPSLDITKLSFFAFSNVISHYELLSSGSALGTGVGPIFISKKEIQKPLKEIKIVAIPGRNTTANLLLSMYYPSIKQKIEMVFSEIEDAVHSGCVDAGVIIHENRFTYERKGLKKISDLGELWEKDTGQPIPLGGIAILRSLPDDVKIKVNQLLKKSIEYALKHPDSSKEYVKKHAQEMSEEIQQKHIQLYVNDYSLDLGIKGRNAISTLFRKANELGIIHSSGGSLFIETV